MVATEKPLPRTLDFRDVPIEMALAHLGDALQELARANIFPLSDLDCTVAVDLHQGRASLHFRACR